MKKFFALILVLILAALPIVSLAASGVAQTRNTETSVTRYVNTGNSGKLNVRNTPNTHADNLITRLENGTQVTVVGYEDGNTWAIIQFKLNNKTATGYVMNRYLSSTKPTVVTVTETVEQKISFKKFKHVEPYTVYVKPATPGGFVNLRWAPSKANDVMDKLYADAELIVIATNGTWSQVYDASTGYVGYIMNSFLRQ